jgi:hypothetical protein
LKFADSGVGDKDVNLVLVCCSGDLDIFDSQGQYALVAWDWLGGVDLYRPDIDFGAGGIFVGVKRWSLH